MAARSKNIFSYLDSDDEDVPKQQNKKQQAPPSAPVALNKPAAGNKKQPKKNAAVEGDNKEKKENRAPREGAPRGEGRGARGRGGRGGRGPRRDFERRSGTGRGKETSKQGGGARNWGNDNDQTELAAEAEVQEGAAKPTSDEETPAEEVEEEEQEVQLTLDEYLAKKKAERSGELFAEVEARQATDDFSNAKQLTKDGKTPDFMEAQYEKVFNKKTSGRKKNLITDVGFTSAAPANERRYRERDNNDNTRGRGRGGRGRGQAGRGRGAAVPNVADMGAFPSLS